MPCVFVFLQLTAAIPLRRNSSWVKDPMAATPHQNDGLEGPLLNE